MKSSGWWVYILYLPIYALENGHSEQLGGALLSLSNAFVFLSPLILKAIRGGIRLALIFGFCSSGSLFLELLASQAAIIADCHYALANHGANFKSLLGDADKGEQMLQAVRNDNFDDNVLFTVKQAVLLKYGAKLCRTPESMQKNDVEQLHEAGVSDTEILEAVQATACFAYWVRFINALGIQLGDESIGLFDEQGVRRGPE